MALRNQSWLEQFACYLLFQVGKFAVDSNCNYFEIFFCQIVVTRRNTSQFDEKYINLTCLSLTNYLISRIGSGLPKVKAAFYRSHFSHCAITYSHLQTFLTPITISSVDMSLFPVSISCTIHCVLSYGVRSCVSSLFSRCTPVLDWSE